MGSSILFISILLVYRVLAFGVTVLMDLLYGLRGFYMDLLYGLCFSI